MVTVHLYTIARFLGETISQLLVLRTNHGIHVPYCPCISDMRQPFAFANER